MPQSEDNFLSGGQWKGQLNLDRPCRAVSSDETCWLCDDFTAWNPVMYPLDLQLAETTPGTMLLRCISEPRGDRDPVTAARETSWLASWLLCHHTCIQELAVECAIGTSSPAAQPSYPIFMRRQSSSPPLRRLRSLSIMETPRSRARRTSAHLVLLDMNAIAGLSTLYVSCGKFDPDFAAEIDCLLERNRDTLRNIHISESTVGRSGLQMLEHVLACEVLTLKFSRIGGSPIADIDTVERLMRSSTTLREVTVQPIDQERVSVIARALETNHCLTKLSIYLKWEVSSEELFRALERNSNLKELFLSESVHVNEGCMRAIASALKNNDCLRTLSMEYIYLHDGVGLGLLSESLSQNRTLHLFYTNSWDIPLREISVLCRALRINKSLTLKLPGVRGSEEESTSLARQLLEDHCYDRVQLAPWREPHLRILSPVLASPEASTGEISLCDICLLSHHSVSILFSALASNRKIKRLSVDVSGDPDARTAILCRTLERAGFIEFLRLKILNEKSATEILRALTVNSTIAELDISFHMTAAERTMTAFSDMLTRNYAITQFQCCFNAADVQPFVEALALGMLRNKLIVALGYTVPAGTCFPPAVYGSVKRNGAALNRAIEFVLERREDRRCAECFEIFFGHSILITNVMEIVGMSDVEARLRVALAEERRREKYLILAGVVRRYVACWLSDVTQIDALNSDCWRVIGGYLSVTDVCCQ